MSSGHQAPSPFSIQEITGWEVLTGPEGVQAEPLLQPDHLEDLLVKVSQE